MTSRVTYRILIHVNYNDGSPVEDIHYEGTWSRRGEELFVGVLPKSVEDTLIEYFVSD